MADDRPGQRLSLADHIQCLLYPQRRAAWLKVLPSAKGG